MHFVRSERGGLKSGAKLIVGSVLLCSAFASHALTNTEVSWTAESDIPADGYGFVGHYVQYGNRYINSGSGTITETVLINGRDDNNSVLGAGIETKNNLTLDFKNTKVSSWTNAHAYVEYMGRIYAGTGQTADQAEATYKSTEVKNNPSLTVQYGSIVLIGSAATGSDNGDGGNSAIFTYYSKSGKQNASRRSTIGALGDVLFKSNSKLTMGSGSHLLSQTGKIEFTDSSLVVDEDEKPLHPFSGNSSEKASIIIWSHGAITAKSAANYVNATETGIWIESHYGDIDWQGQEFNARLNSGIWNRSGNVSLVTLKQAGDNSHNSGAISLTGGSVEAAYGEKNGQVKLAANGTLNTSGIALNNTKVLGNAVILAANAGLMGTDDQALESLLNRDNNILNLSNGAHIGKLGATGETQDSSEQATESLTIYADAVLNDRSGGEAKNITVKGGVSLDETTAGTYASHLIAQNKLDIDASGKDVSIQNGAYLQTTGTDEAGITIKADKVNMGTTGNKIGSSISTGGSSVSVTAGSISMGTGSQLGNESTGSVELTSSSITLNSDSHINSSDEVKIVASEGNNLSISMDQTNVGSNASSIKGNKVTIGDDQNASQLTLTGGSIQSTSTDADNGVNINFSSGKDGDSSISGTQIGSGSEVVKIAGTGNLNLTNLTNDEKTPTIVNGASVSIDVNDGNLAIVGANDGESANNTHIIGGTIELSANKVSLDDQGWIQSDSSGSLTVTTPELALGGGAHIGTGTLDGASQEGGNVTVNTNKVSLDAGSYITSQGAVNITPSEGSEGGLTIDMTPSAGGGVDGWIKGGSVTVGSVDQVGGTSIEGGSIAGSRGSVTIAGGSSKDGDNSGVVINESTVSTGAGGSVKIEAVGGAPIQIGTENAAGDTINKDTQIIGGNITIGSADGTVNKPSDVTVNGGNFTVEGGIDLTHPDADGNNTSADDDGDIIIRDHNTTNPDAENGLTVAGDVAAGDLVMGGGDTNLDVGGDLSLSGSASLTGNADVDVAGSITVDDVLDMSGTSSLGKDHAASDAADEGTEGNLTVGGLDITDSASIDRNDVDVNGNAHINGNGSLTADGNFDVAGELQIGTGEDIDGNETAAGNPTVSVSGDITVGKDFTVGNVDGEGSATVEATNDITVSDGNATIHGNGQVTAGGSFDVNGSGDNGNATIEGSLTANDADIDNNLTVGKEDSGSLEPNGSFVTDGSTNVGGNVVVNENGELSVGMNASGDDQGNLTVGGSLTTGAGSNVDVGGDLSVEESASIAGNVEVGGAADFNSGLIVGADPDSEGNVPNPNGSFASSGKTDVNGNLIVNGNSSVSVGLVPSGEDDDSLKVENGYADIDAGSTVTVGGAFEVTGTGGAGEEGEPTQGSAHVAGSVAADSANISQDLVVGDAFEEGKAPSNNGSFVTDNDAEVGGNVTVNDNGTLTVGTDKGEGPADLTIGGSLTTGAGSDSTVTGNLVVGNNGEADATIGGSLTVNGSGVEGTPSADFNGNLVVEAGGSFTNKGAHDGVTDTNVAGNATIGEANSDEKATADLGDAVIVGSTTVANADVTSGDFTGNGLKVTDDSSFAAEGGDIKLEGSDANLIVKDSSLTASASGEGENAKGGNVTVGGYADLANGTVSIDGELKIEGTNEAGLGLVIGNGIFETEEQPDTTVTVGSINVGEGSTLINGDGKLEANGSANFGGGLQLGAGGAFVNNSDKATTVSDEFILNAGASVDTKGEFTLVAETTVGNTDGTGLDQGVLHGTISAGSIDLGNLSGNTITFAGGTTSTDEDATRFEAGFETGSLTGNVALSNGANAVLTPSADGKAPVVNGFITVADGDAEKKILGNTLTTNAANKGDYSNADVTSGNSTNAVVNMDSAINFTGSNSGLIVGDVGTFTPSESGIYFGANSSLVIDASNMTSGSVLFGNGTDKGMGIDVVGDGTIVSVDLSGWTMGTGGSLVFDVAAADEDKFEFTSSNILQQFGINGGKIQMTVADIGEATGGTLDGSLLDVVGKVTANAGNTYVGQAFDKVFSSASGLTALNPENEQDQAVIADLMASGAVPDGATNIIKTPFGYQYTTEDGKTVLALNGSGNKAVEEIATFPVTAGAFNATYEYLTEFNRAVEVRALEDRPEGLNRSVWAHVIATFNKSDELFGGSGYSADLYGGVLGTDVVVGGNTLVGGALTVGSGDIESRGAVIGSKNDATFYGVSLYAEHNIGAMSVKGDVTYLKTENDISSTFNGVNMGGSMDTDAISVGIRAEFKAYESDTFEVKPHLGIRYTNYSFDNYRGTDIDDVNAIESPIGVAFSGKVAATGGWTVVPELDLSVVPQLGDKEASVVNAGAAVDQRVLEGAVFNAKIGLGMQKDNFTFGANFQHGAGGFSRNNNAFQAFARWTF